MSPARGGGSVRVDTSDFRRFAGAMKDADRAVPRRVAARLRKIAPKLGREVRAEGALRMPRRGGLRSRVAGASVRVTAGWSKDPTVDVSLHADGASIPHEDTGVVTHPVFGNRGVWVRQSVPARSWAGAIEKRMPKIRDEIHAEIESIVRDIARNQ